jgi:ribosome-binding factor A
MSREDGPVGQRQLRVGEELRHALAWILERGEVHDPAVATVAVTVTEVRISPDLRQATVFVMPLGGREEASVVAALGRAKGFLRRRIAESVRLKFVPDLAFRIDRSFEQADRITRILRDPAVSRDIGHDQQRDVEDESGDGPRG